MWRWYGAVPGTNPFDMEASVTSPDGVTELCDVVDLEDFHYKIMFTPQVNGMHTLSVRHKGMHISGECVTRVGERFLVTSKS